MENASKKCEFIIENLTCAHCAGKIESEIANFPGVESATLNFVSKKVNVLSTIEEDKLYTELSILVDKIEPGVVLKNKVDVKKSEGTNKNDFLIKKGTPILLSILLLIVAMNMSGGLSLGLYVLSYFIVATPVLIRAWRTITNGSFFDENTLMGIATIGAFAIGEYSEAVAVILFYSVGEILQSIAVQSSRASIENLLSLKAEIATVVVGDTTKQVEPQSIAVGTIVRVKAGERVPLDGIVIRGESTIDTSAITGESLPVDIGIESEVLSGTINMSATFDMKVTKVADESMVAKILESVEEASNKKAKTEAFITQFAKYYTPAVVGIAAIVAVIPPLLFGQSFEEWLYRALIFLVISCPCALVISIPLTYFGGIGGASKRGVLLKGGNVLEGMEKIKTIIFDKTGTLTTGKFVVDKIVTHGETTENRLLELAAVIESHSNHPIAKSIVKAYKEDVKNVNVDEVREIAGFGLTGVYQDKALAVGNRKHMLALGIEVHAVHSAHSIVYVAYDNIWLGYIEVKDEVKKEAKEALAQLRRAGVERFVMLTGDKAEVAEETAKTLGLENVHADLLPADKLTHVEKYCSNSNENEFVAFVGDGINDTPALARADVSIAMGAKGQDAAIDLADVVLMNDNLDSIAQGIAIAKKTKKIVWQNIILALGVKLIFIILGLFDIATMWEAVFADVGVTLLAIANASRILKN
ncbi:MAG: heavy metal translocating P-type ATPase [Bacilli bacterium]